MNFCIHCRAADPAAIRSNYIDIFSAVWNNNAVACQEYIEIGGDVNARTVQVLASCIHACTLSCSPKPTLQMKNASVLHEAAAAGHFDLVKMLVKHGADSAAFDGVRVVMAARRDRAVRVHACRYRRPARAS